MRRMISSALLAVASFSVLFFVTISVAAAPAPPKAAKVKAGRYGNAGSITADEMKIYDYFLASDQLQGRNLPSNGYDTAALYVASHLAEWGLKPGGSTTGTNGPLQPYFMPFELVSRSVVADESKAAVTAPERRFGRRGPAQAASGPPRTVDFEYGKDWMLAGGGFRGPSLSKSVNVSGNLVFAGNGYVINKTNTDPYQGLDVHGKIIVVAGVPPEIAAQQAAAGARRGAPPPSPLGENCTDYLTPEEYAAKSGALAVVSIANFQQLAAMANSGAPAPSPANGPAFQVTRFAQAPKCPSAPAIVAGVRMTNLLFEGEKLSPSAALYAVGSNAKEASFPLNAEKKLDLHVSVRSEQGHAENVVGILEGGDPVLKSEYVVISAHLDHIGLSQVPLPDGDNINNGADDDGSGSTGLLAIARSFAQGAQRGVRPKRSIIFLWNGGEEKGLWGSRYFTEFPPVDLSKVVANLNMDMIGRTKGPGYSDPDPTHALVNPGEVFVVGPNISSDDLEKTIETVNNNFQKLALNHFYDATAPDATHDNLGPKPNGQRIFYRSDHYNFAKMGIPIAFFCDGLHPDYHRPTDSPDKLDFREIQQVSQTVAAVAWVLGTEPGRPKLNQKLPDQLVKDMKTSKEDGWGTLTPVMPPLANEPF
ncbi:MAG TPA: M28 family peptidase [Candidatus Acidoferrales bacterium]|nr:M28 family peptidase [Candidatus Acidoferrales bacterium]